MVERLIINNDGFYVPDANLLITEDDSLDNFATAKYKRLLVSSLYTSFQNQPFLASANVGIYYAGYAPPIVPDILIALDIQTPENWWDKENRCYINWHFCKSPEVVLEIVSNKEGEELGKKLRIYEQMRVYYIVYNPIQQLGDKTLRVYELRGRRYFETSENRLEQVGLGVTFWQGEFEGRQDNWLRWCYPDGNLLLTGDELAQQERERAEQERQRAEQERQRAEQAEARAQVLAERLRAMGIDPDAL